MEYKKYGQCQRKKDYYDLIYVGTSMVITNISAEEIYLNYGIPSISIGEPLQMTFLSYYSLEEALKFQNPKVVIYDTQALFYTEEIQELNIDQDEAFYIHTTLDNLDNLKTKYEAVKQVKSFHPSSTYLEYFSKMYYNHAKWKNISKDNFVSLQNKDIIMGSRSLLGILENTTNDDVNRINMDDNKRTEIPEVNKEYLYKIKNLCDKNDVQLILVRSCGKKFWYMDQYNAIEELAREMNVDFLDLAIYEEQIGFDWRTDSYDGTHHNVSGTKKWSDFLGEYLINNYDFNDRRGDKKYQEFEDARIKYEDALSVINQKINLINATNFYKYLDTLYNIEKDGNTIFISISDDASTNLTDWDQNQLNAIGFNVNLKGKYGSSYYGVLDDGKIVVEECGEKSCEAEGKLSNGIPFKIISGGMLSGIKASIIIDGTEQIQGGEGINIVVYNKKKDEVLSSVFFDTFNTVNPTTSRINDTGEIEEESDINFWTTK